MAPLIAVALKRRCTSSFSRHRLYRQFSFYYGSHALKNILSYMYFLKKFFNLLSAIACLPDWPEKTPNEVLIDETDNVFTCGSSAVFFLHIV